MKIHLFLSLALSCATTASAVPPSIASELFPDAIKAPEIQRGGVILQLGPRGSMRLTPVFVEPARDHAQWANTPWCGVVLTAGARSQGIVTVGQGYTEVLKCRELLAAGVLQSQGSSPRIGLIYATEQPHGGGERIALILARDAASGNWAVDETATERLSAKSVPRTIADMRRRLERVDRSE